MKQTMTILVVALLFLEWSAGESVARTSDADTKAIGIAEAVRDLPSSVKAPNRYALVIGTGQYEDERIPALPASLNDARRLYEVLIDLAVGMFPPENVTLLLDEEVTRPKVVSALDSLGRKAGKEDLVIVFFSGHGAVDDRGRPYWVMQNTKMGDLRASALSKTKITELLDEIKTTRLVTLIDACYSASTAEIGWPKALVDIQKIYPKFKGEGRVAITGSKGDQLSVVISDKKHEGYGHSAFTWHVIAGMKGKGDTDRDGVVTVNELWGYIKDRTETTARQQGGNQQPQLKGQIGSKFLLTVDGERLVANNQQTRESVEALKRLFPRGAISSAQYEQTEKLLTSNEKGLDETQLGRRKAKFASLMSQAKAKDDRKNGRQALRLLEEALRLYPGDTGALELQKKIRGYFGPNSGDVIVNSVGMKLVYIPLGEFMMGSRDSAAEVASKGGGEGKSYANEHPQYRVRLSKGFYMGVTEVTQAQWEAVMGTTVDQQRNKANTSRPLRGEGANCPMYYISWEEAVEFCRKLSQEEGKIYRLPTEAEWEYTCRAGTTTPFNTGETISTGQANYDGNHAYGNGRKGVYREKTTEVGSFSANGFGLYDMHGNVWEWCSDWYEEDYYSSSLGVDPKGSSNGPYRVLRGGSWFSDPWFCRSAARYWYSPGSRYFNIGFRVVFLDL